MLNYLKLNDPKSYFIALKQLLNISNASHLAYAFRTDLDHPTDITEYMEA